jgi:hypothetical protein
VNRTEDKALKEVIDKQYELIKQLAAKNMINKINKERQRSMNATPI